MTLEDWNTAFQFGSAVLLGMTFFVGAGAIWTSFVVNKRLTERVATAGRASAEANEKAAAAAEGTAKALANAAEANKLAESFRLDIARANERAAEANVTAERERLARLQLEARLADRTLTAEQRASIASVLRRLGRISVQILTFSDITEVLRIGDVIGETLNAAGWQCAVATAAGGVRVNGMVLAVGQAASTQVKTAAATLASELARNGVEAKLATETIEEIPRPRTGGGMFLESAQIKIMIGPK